MPEGILTRPEGRGRTPYTPNAESASAIAPEYQHQTADHAHGGHEIGNHPFQGGLAVALPIAIAVTHAMASILFGLALLSAASVVGFAALFVLVALAAGYVPAWRAMRVDPLVALRNE